MPKSYLKYFILIAFVFCFAQYGRGQKQDDIGDSVRKYSYLFADDTSAAYLQEYFSDSMLKTEPFTRAFIHGKIAKERNLADLSDGRLNHRIFLPDDPEGSELLSEALFQNIGQCIALVENMPIPKSANRDSATENQEKIRCLTAIWDIVKKFNNDPQPDVTYYVNRIKNLPGLIIASNENKVQQFAESNCNIYTLDNGRLLFDNESGTREYLYRSIGLKQPQVMMKRLADFANDTFAESIITLEAHLEPEIVFNYATSTNIVIRGAIERTKDTLVQAIVTIANTSRAPLKAMSFLSDICHGTKTIDEIDSITANQYLYFTNLIRVKIAGDTSGKSSYTRELHYRTLQFVRKLNELHLAPDSVRFQCLDSLDCKGLYYVMTEGQDEIYTSSYLGTFKRFMAALGPVKGNQFLDSVKYDEFRTFIRMNAVYNTLPTFLSTFTSGDVVNLMDRFISDLEKGDAGNLEQAVDVAEALSSIADTQLLSYLANRVKENFESSFKSWNKKGIIVYTLLGRLIESSQLSVNDSGAASASKLLHTPPINVMPFQNLIDDSGGVTEQAFFYGDDDGQISFQAFLSVFKDTAFWKTDSTDSWYEITSVGKTHIKIYANKPLLAPEDEAAQKKLDDFLQARAIKPSIIIHRGHSYHLSYTLNHLNAGVKLVILGSCGGYHNLSFVLDKAPDAQIIATKQTGFMAINDPIIKEINQQLFLGNDLNWIRIWKNLDALFDNNEDLKLKFSDYIPPYRNLGAVFIKAYKKMAKYY